MELTIFRMYTIRNFAEPTLQFCVFCLHIDNVHLICTICFIVPEKPLYMGSGQLSVNIYPYKRRHGDILILTMQTFERGTLSSGFPDDLAREGGCDSRN